MYIKMDFKSKDITRMSIDVKLTGLPDDVKELEALLKKYYEEKGWKQR